MPANLLKVEITINYFLFFGKDIAEMGVMPYA